MTSTSDKTQTVTESNLPEAEVYQPGFPEDEAQRTERIRKLFDGFDYEKTGFLTRKNIQRGLKRLKNHPVRDKYASELLEKCDTSADGVVDFKEFKAFVEEKEKELLKLFLQIDGSRDMRLQPEELEVALKKAGINCTKADLEKFIRVMDEDGNGVIEFSEWRDFLLLLPRDTTMFEIYEYYQMVGQVSFDGEVTVPPTDPKYLAAGAIAGAVSRTATAPLDRLKVYLQIQTAISKGVSNTNVKLPRSEVVMGSNNLTNAMREIYAGGVLNFFRGNGLNIAKIAPESAIKFFTYEKSKAIIAHMMGVQDSGSIGLSGRFLSGGFGGIASQFAIYPLETLKTRIMSSDRGSSYSPKGKVLWNTALEMWRVQGFRSFYKGLVPSLIGVFPYAAVDMSIYETLKLGYLKRVKMQLKGEDPIVPNALVSLSCGMVSGSVGAIIVYPLSLVRTRLQAQGTSGHPQKYSGAFDVIRKTYAEDRVRGFYKGLVPAMTKVVPAAAISYVVYDKCKSILSLQ
ncbi:8052_t:CDS:2 [Acaulospora morrowiae]|uniref:8052_t:CDS:1 n=1 Tax=Acaulospora morrowiae TaxID=94023 RepID=A0A9N8V7C9_9GLOM|nr:8052_t:CDS:2 [Acaulospora morrowiae]